MVKYRHLNDKLRRENLELKDANRALNRKVEGMLRVMIEYEREVRIEGEREDEALVEMLLSENRALRAMVAIESEMTAAITTQIHEKLKEAEEGLRWEQSAEEED